MVAQTGFDAAKGDPVFGGVKLNGDAVAGEVAAGVRSRDDDLVAMRGVEREAVFRPRSGIELTLVNDVIDFLADALNSTINT